MQSKLRGRVIALALVFLMAVLALSGCSANVSNPSIGKVGDVELFYSDLYQAYSTYYMYYAYGMVTLEEGQTFGDYLVSILVESTMPIAAAYAEGMTLDAEEEEQLAAEVQEAYQTALDNAAASLEEGASEDEIYAAFIESIKENGYTYDSYMARLESELRDEFLRDKILERVYADADVTNEDIEAWYKEQLEADTAEYTEDPAAYYEDYTYYPYNTGVKPLYVPEGYDYIKQIYIAFAAEDADEATKQAVADKVAEVQAKIDAGEDFDALIEEYNEDTGASSNPEGYIYRDEIADQYYEAFSTAASAMEVGEITGPVESTSGYHFLYKVGPVPSGAVPLEEVKDAISSYLLEEREHELYSQAITKWYEEISVDMNTTRINYYLNSIASSSAS